MTAVAVPSPSFLRPIPAFALGVLLGCIPPPLRAAETKPAPKFEVRTVKNVAYYEGTDAHKVKHKLDLFVPRGHKDFPVLFFVHGGAWRHGDKDFLGIYTALGQFFARHGIGTVVTNYRLSPAVKHPEHVRDVARAFAWTRKNIARYGGRPGQIFACGHSAGGHLVALLATDPRYLEAVGLSVKDVRGVISISGIFDIPDWLLPSVFGPKAETRRAASPLRHVTKGLPPFLVLCASKDYPGCDKKPAEAFCKALQAKGNKARFLEVTPSSHFQIILSASLAGHVVSRTILDFIRDNTARP